MRVTVIGTGYVGLVQGACLSATGNHVICVDRDESKITSLLEGVIPIYEPGLEDIVAKNSAAGRLEFTTDLGSAVRNADSSPRSATPPGPRAGDLDRGLHPERRSRSVRMRRRHDSAVGDGDGHGAVLAGLVP